MTSPARKLEPVAVRLAGFLARDEKGDPITRSAQCECGRVFQQFLLNPTMIGLGSENIQREYMRQIPHGYVPVFCPSCERKDLASTANRVRFP